MIITTYQFLIVFRVTTEPLIALSMSESSHCEATFKTSADKNVYFFLVCIFSQKRKGCNLIHLVCALSQKGQTEGTLPKQR